MEYIIVLEEFDLKKRNILCGVIFVFITIFIFSNSSKSASDSTLQSDSWVDIFLNYLSFIFKDPSLTETIVRKLAHFSEFFIQGAALSGCIFTINYNKNFIYVLFTGILTACVDEYIQLFFEGRGSQVSDIFIDFSGTCFSVIIFIIIWYFIKKKAGK